MKTTANEIVEQVHALDRAGRLSEACSFLSRYSRVTVLPHDMYWMKGAYVKAMDAVRRMYPEPKRPAGPKSLLIVDDGPSHQVDYFAYAESLMDVRVGYAEDVEHAKAMIDLMSIRGLDLVITDFDLPGGDGNDVAAYVREKSPRTRVVGSTGGPPERFDSSLVDLALDKIVTREQFMDVVYSGSYAGGRIK